MAGEEAPPTDDEQEEKEWSDADDELPRHARHLIQGQRFLDQPKPQSLSPPQQQWQVTHEWSPQSQHSNLLDQPAPFSLLSGPAQQTTDQGGLIPLINFDQQVQQTHTSMAQGLQPSHGLQAAQGLHNNQGFHLPAQGWYGPGSGAGRVEGSLPPLIPTSSFQIPQDQQQWK